MTYILLLYLIYVYVLYILSPLYIQDYKLCDLHWRTFIKINEELGILRNQT